MIYETETDLRREAYAIKLVARLLRIHVDPTPRLADLDATSGPEYGFEHKGRDWPHPHADVFLENRKLRALHRHKFGIFVVSFWPSHDSDRPAEVRWVDVRKQAYTTATILRTDRPGETEDRGVSVPVAGMALAGPEYPLMFVGDKTVAVDFRSRIMDLL